VSDDLTRYKVAPASGTARSAVLFLHGYGADARDLLGLAQPLAPHLPDTAFHAVDAPERCLVNPMGYQWFPIPAIDGAPEEAMRQSFARSVGLLNATIDTILQDEDLAPTALFLFGFSQGSMMSLHIAPRRAETLGGVIGISGRMVVPETLKTEIQSRPPIQLIHGDMDEVVPFGSLAAAEQALLANEVPVTTHVMHGTGHGISPDGLTVALEFLRARTNP
jgi:phospholipase/carboxylesterase